MSFGAVHLAFIPAAPLGGISVSFQQAAGYFGEGE